MPSLEELGRRVKLKYPGSYDDLSDYKLGKSVQGKFPGAYDDFQGTDASVAMQPDAPLSENKRIRRIQMGFRAAEAEREAAQQSADLNKEIIAGGVGTIASLPFGGPVTPQGLATKQLARFVAQRAIAGAVGGGVAGGVEAGITGRDILPAIGTSAGFGALFGGLLGGLGAYAPKIPGPLGRPVFGGAAAEAGRVAEKSMEATKARGAVAMASEQAQRHLQDIADPNLRQLPEPPTAAQQPLVIERFERMAPFRAENMSGAARAAAESSPVVKNLHRGLFAELHKHPALADREARIAWAKGVLGRDLKSFNDLTTKERRKLMTTLKTERKRAALVPEAKRLQEVTEAMDNRMNDLPESDFATVAQEARSLWHTAFSSVTGRLKRMGPAGSKFAAGMERAEDLAARQEANALLDFKEAIKGFKEKDRILIGEVMQGAPTDRLEIRAAAQKVSKILEGFADQAERVGQKVYNTATGKAERFARMPNYYPRIHTPRSINKLPAKEARLARQQMMAIPPRWRGGGISFSRVADIPGWERDPLKAIPIYIKRTSHRLSVSEVFGADDSIANQMLKQINQEAGGDANRKAHAMWTAFASPARREFDGILQPIRDAATVGMLTTTAVLQPAQLANTVARTGAMNTLRGLAALRSPVQREWSARTGATVGSILNEISPDGKSIASFWSKTIGLSESDRGVRLASALAYKMRAQEIIEAAIKGRLTKGMRFDAEHLGIDLDDVVRKGGISEEQMSLLAQRGSNETQFATRYIDLPTWRENGIGRTILLFKSFALQQGRFVRGLIKDAQRGHWAPLLRFVAASSVISQPLGEVIRKMRGNEPPDHPVWRFIDNWSYAASLGVFQDLVRAVHEGDPKALLEFAGGPVVSEGADIAASAGQVGKTLVEEGELDVSPLQRKLIERTVRRVPFVGKELAEEMEP